MKILATFLAILLGTASAISVNIGDSCPSTLFTNLVKPLNYPVEEHKVVTEDGYILRVFRIQKKGTQIKNGLPVLILQHGNEDSSDTFVMNDEDKSLAFEMANQGYDIWLPNNRGNKYSTQHKTMSKYQKAFWDFSFQEMGEKDIPSCVKYILEVTGQEKVTMAGHSQGNTQMISGLSSPVSSDYLNSKLTKFIALAPVIYMTQTQSSVFQQFSDNPYIFTTCNAWGVYQLFPASCSETSLENQYMQYLCTFANDICKYYLNGGDLDPTYDNTAKLNIFFTHTPCGASVRQFQHYVQLYDQKKSDPKFEMYDFGTVRNIKEYGQSTPLTYDFTNIKIPITLFIGIQDRLGDTADNEILFQKLQHAGVTANRYVYEQWGHMTFVWGLNMTQFYADFGKEVREASKFANEKNTKDE